VLASDPRAAHDADIAETRMTADPRILVMGCGGIGGIIAASLFERDYRVVAVTHNSAITAAINARGFTVQEDEHRRIVRGQAVTALPADAGAFDVVLLATQPPQVIEAARTALPFLTAAGTAVCFQNGLCEQHVAEVVGAGRTIGAIVAWGGSMPEPGVYDRTSAGGFTIGRLDGTDDPRFAVLRRALEPIGPVEVTHNLRGARWSKLAINCAISSLGTLGGTRLGRLIRYRFVRRLALEVMTEAVTVARRRSVRLEKVAGTIDLDWITLTPADLSGPGSPSLMAKHALLLAVGAKFRRLRSSMLAAIERGREPAVDYLNGEVIRRAARLGLPVPVNERVHALVLAIWRGHARPGLPLLRDLYRATRAEARRALLAYQRGAEPPDAAAPLT
jgi:2-dehydropantoate 2-reductase